MTINLKHSVWLHQFSKPASCIRNLLNYNQTTEEKLIQSIIYSENIMILYVIHINFYKVWVLIYVWFNLYNIDLYGLN